MKLLFNTLLLLSLFSIPVVRAAHGSGNGGDGVMLACPAPDQDKNCPYLLDLVEEGIYHSSYINENVSYSTHFKMRMMADLELSEPVATKIAKKVGEIDQINPLLGGLIKTVMFELQWRFNDLKLVDVKDHGDTVYDFSNLDLVQLAVRKGYQVTVNNMFWDQLDENNQVALIIHECLYSLSDHVSIPISQNVNAIIQQGHGTRVVVGKLFNRSYMERVHSGQFNSLLRTNSFSAFANQGNQVKVSYKKEAELGYIFETPLKQIQFYLSPSRLFLPIESSLENQLSYEFLLGPEVTQGRNIEGPEDQIPYGYDWSPLE